MRKRPIWWLPVLTLALLTLWGCKSNDMPEIEAPDQSQSGLNTPVPTPSPEPKEPIVISMVGDCTLASSQYNSDFETDRKSVV